MLPPHIIEHLRERERLREEQDRPQPVLELPLPSPRRRAEPVEEAPSRGVTIIDLW